MPCKTRYQACTGNECCSGLQCFDIGIRTVGVKNPTSYHRCEDDLYVRVNGLSAVGGESENKEENGSMNGLLIDPVIACGLVIIMILVCMIKRVLFSTSN